MTDTIDKHDILALDDDQYPITAFGNSNGREGMVPTQEQRHAMFRKWKQAQHGDDCPTKRMTWAEFASSCHPTFGMDNAITVEWCGMWLAIEKDGYTHS